MIQNDVLAKFKEIFGDEGHQSIFCTGTCKSDR